MQTCYSCIQILRTVTQNIYWKVPKQQSYVPKATMFIQPNNVSLLPAYESSYSLSFLLAQSYSMTDFLLAQSNNPLTAFFRARPNSPLTIFLTVR